MSDMQQLLDTHDEKQINDIATEYGKLFDWFHEEYPEGRIRLDVNNDKRIGNLSYRLTVLTGKEMADNQGFFENTVTITKEKFENPQWMDAYKSSIVPHYKRTITEAVNKHYYVEKEKRT